MARRDEFKITGKKDARDKVENTLKKQHHIPVSKDKAGNLYVSTIDSAEENAVRKAAKDADANIQQT